jgi:hypothetical protein
MSAFIPVTHFCLRRPGRWPSPMLVNAPLCQFLGKYSEIA